MAVKHAPALSERLQDAVAGLGQGFDPRDVALEMLGRAMALPWPARIAVALAALWLGVLAGLIVIRFSVLLALHLVEGGLLFVNYASAQLMRVLTRAWQIVKGCAVFALWTVTAPFAAALRGSKARLDRMAGAMRNPRKPRPDAAAPPPGPEPVSERAWALNILRLPEDFTPAQKKARLLELRKHLNSDQHPFLSDAFVQLVNQADLILRKRGSTP